MASATAVLSPHADVILPRMKLPLPDFTVPLPPFEVPEGQQRLIQFREALREAMSEEMRRDKRIFLLGEEVAQYNGAYKISQGMLDEFGPKRIIDSPISENGFAGLAVGAAMYGLKPIIEFMSWSFSLVAADQILNNVPKMLYMSGGQWGCPVVFRGNDGAGGQLGSTHSWCVEGLYSNVPGVKIVIPSNGAATCPVPDRMATNTNSPDVVQYASSGSICPAASATSAPPSPPMVAPIT